MDEPPTMGHRITSYNVCYTKLLRIVSETLACGRPLILFSSTAGQETGNVEYVTSNGAGDWAPTPAKALASLVRWLAGDGTILAERTANARRAGRLV